MRTWEIQRRRKREQRGSALLLAIFFLMLLFLVALALFRVIPGELHSVGRTRQDLQAHYAATGGVKHAARFLMAALNTAPGSIAANTIPPNEPFEMTPSNAGNECAYRETDTPSSSPGGIVNSQPASRFTAFGTDFDGVAFAAKPHMEIVQDLQTDVDGDGQPDWYTHVWIFPDRNTYPIPERFPGLQQPGDQVSGRGLRYYTIIAEASPFRPVNPRLRVKVTIGQQNLAGFARFMDEWPGDETPTDPDDDISYSAFNNVKSVAGPFHTNSYFRIAPASGYFNAGGTPTTSSFDDLSYNTTNPPAGTDYDSANWDDQAGYIGGNHYGYQQHSYSQNNLPWDSNHTVKPFAYEKLVGNRANLHYVQKKDLPSTTTDLQKAAWGFGNPNPVPGNEGAVGNQGVFIRHDGGSSGDVNGGVYMIGDTRDSALGLVDSTLGVVGGQTRNVLTSTGNYNASGNPAMQMEFSQTIGNASLLNPITNTYTTSQSILASTQVGTTQSVSTIRTVTATQTTVRPVTRTNRTTITTGTNVSQATVRTPITSQSTYACGTIQGQGMGQAQTIYCTTNVTTGTQTTVTNATHYVTSVSTSFVVTNQTVRTRLTQTTYQTTDVPVYVTNTTWATNVTSSVTNQAPNFNPVDRVVEVKEGNVTIGPKIVRDGQTLTVVDQSGATIPSSGLVVGSGNVVLLKDSRVYGDVAVVTTYSGTLNGMVYSEGNIDNLHGISKGRKTIATDIGAAGTDSGNRITIGNKDSGERGDLLQWGTEPGEPSPNGDNILGLVAQKVGMNIDGNSLRSVYGNSNKQLYIHAIILAGRSGDEDTDPYSTLAQSRKGGMRIFNLGQSFNGVSAIRRGRQGYFNLRGGLIERLGAQSWNVQGNQLTGWNSAFSFDPWGARLPPPFFPTTNAFTPVTMVEEVMGTTYRGGGFTSSDDSPGW